MAQCRPTLLRGLILGMCSCIVACGGSPSAPPEVDVPEVNAPASSPEVTTSDPLPSEAITGSQDSPSAAPLNATEPEATDESPLGSTDFIPGERFGPVTLETSRADLVTLFGAEALQDTEIPAGEGTTELGTRVTLEPDRSFSVVWVDDAQTRPLLVKEFGPAWLTPEGIGLGMSFTELQTVLGPFSFYGFGWDYGGTVILEGTNLEQDYGQLIMRLQPDLDPEAPLPEALQAVMGDGTFDAEAVDLTGLGVTVSEVIVYLNDGL